MAAEQRQTAIGEQIRRLLGPVLLHEVSDPRLRQLNISEVEMSRDLRHATVYIISANRFDAARRAEIKQGFTSSQAFLRRVIGKRAGLRYVPKLKFVLDETLDHAQRIDQLLQDSERSAP